MSMASSTAEAASSNARPILFVMAAQASFTGNDVLLKLATAELPGGQAIFLRGIMAFLVAVSACSALGALRFETLRGHGRLLVQRNIGEIGATFCFMFALFNMPIGPATAILQSIPLAITAGAALFLGEHVGWRRWLATAIGFLGVLIIIRPGGEAFNAWSLLALLSVAFTVVRDFATRRISRQVPAMLLVMISAVTVMLAASAYALVETWVVPSTRSLQLVFLSGCFLVGGYFLMVDAMRYGEVSVVAPFRYAAIPCAVVAGLVVWGEWPDAMALFGIGLIVAAGLYTFMRERKLMVLVSRKGARS